MTNYHCLAPIL